MAGKYDYIIIGGGPGGYETAAEAAALGCRVLLVERDALGGTCLNRGCIPTKCLAAAAEKIVAISGSSEFGVDVKMLSVDYGTARRRAAEVMDVLRDGIGDILKGVDVVNGEACISSGPVVIVGETEYAADKIVIATGSCPVSLRCNGADETIDSDRFLELEQLPERLTIVGGGVIGLEFASIASVYDTKVTVLEYCPEILPNFDADIAKRLRTYLVRRGIDIIVGAEVTDVSGGNVRYIRKGKEKAVDGDMVLCAVGRHAVVPDGCEKVGIRLDSRGYIFTDDHMETSVPGVYAIGDCNGRCLLAHAASAQGRIVLGEDVRIDVMPSVVFTMPECASVGRGGEGCASVKLPYGANGKALATGQSDGLLKIEYDTETELLRACHVVGAHASDIVAVMSLALVNEMTVRQLSGGVVFAHPTLSELLSQACKQI